MTDTITLEEIPALLDQLALDMANALMPSPTDPDRARKAYILGLASASVKHTAKRMRQMLAPPEARVFRAQPPAGARLS